MQYDRSMNEELGKGEGGEEPPGKGGLGLQFVAAGLALSVFLTVVALAAYLVLSR